MQTPNTHALRSAVRSVPFRVAVFASGAIALGSLTMNYTDNRATVGYTQVCFQPTDRKILKKAKKQGKQYCTASQRYWISDPILNAWERDKPEFYGKLVRLKSTPPQNQHKWMYGAIAIWGGLVVAGLGASRLNLINRLAPGYRKETQAQWHRDSVRNGVQMATDAVNGRYAVQRHVSASEVAFGRYQAALLSPEELAATQQAYLDAEYHARLQGQQEASNIQPEQAQLPGQSMEDVANPGDKVSSGDVHVKCAGKIESSGNFHASIKPGLIQTLEQSAIAPILKAGVLKVIGGQGSGKTTLVNGGLLRYRLHVGHKLIIINSHKSFDMYRGLEPYLETGTKFYGVGASDSERANSLVEGMKVVLGILEQRYTQYQNQSKGTYAHYPITILIEESGEWTGLLGDKGLPLIQTFWQKMFIACRKAVLFPIITAQDDTMTMFGNPKGLAELIKNTGSVTLNLIAQPDANSPDGWKPSGKGILYIPNQDSQKIDVPNIRDLVVNPDIFTDLNNQSSQPQAKPQTNQKIDKVTALNAARSLIDDCWNQKPELSEEEKIMLDWIIKRKKEEKSYDARTASQNISSFKHDSSISKVDAIRAVFRQLHRKEYGKLKSTDIFEPFDL
jgi:hypothetical protein